MKWIKSGLYLIPSLIILQWVIFGACLLSKGDSSLRGSKFTQKLLKYIGISISKKKSANISSFILILTITIMFYRLMHEK